MVKLTAAQIENAKSWLTDLFTMAGMYSDLRPETYPWSQHSYAYKHYPDIKTAALNIYKEITNRKFTNIDKDLATLSEQKFGASLSSEEGIKKTPEVIAKYLAWFCDNNKVFWNDTIMMPEELTEFKESIFGKAIVNAELLVSQIPTVKMPSIPGSGRTSSTSSTPRVAGVPKSDYKSTGPRSKDCRDLKSAVSAKEYLSGPVYAIMGKMATAKAPAYAFIRPLAAKGATGSTNKVYLGRDSGYVDCACWFADKAEAYAFLTKCTAICPSGITELTVGIKGTADKNGYFKVGTEFGDCYIKASRLNEEITESCESCEEVNIDALLEQNYPQTDIISDITIYNKTPNFWEN